MEKRVPQYDLEVAQAMIRESKVRATKSALAGSAELGLDFQGMIEIVLSLTGESFHKSMTTYHDHRIWQDVYRPETVVGDVYLKLTVIDDVLIVSFKAL
ncbi:MAG: type II toxin-antitoxin system MqsR family toxin [Gammaproteobacteria bacterium]